MIIKRLRNNRSKSSNWSIDFDTPYEPFLASVTPAVRDRYIGFTIAERARALNYMKQPVNAKHLMMAR